MGVVWGCLSILSLRVINGFGSRAKRRINGSSLLRKKDRLQRLPHQRPRTLLAAT